MILVTGGAGNVGASVVDQLLDAGEKVRVMTRDPDVRHFPDGVEVVAGDLTRAEEHCRRVAPAGRTGRHRVGAAVDLRASRRLHDQRPGLGVADHRRRGRPRRVRQRGTGPDPRDIAAVAVRALLDRRTGEAFVLTGPQSLTQIERVRIIAETIGRPLRFEEVTPDTFREQMLRHGLAAPVIEELIAGLAARDGKAQETSPAVEELTGRPPYTYAQWAAHHAAAFGAAPA